MSQCRAYADAGDVESLASLLFSAAPSWYCRKLNPSISVKYDLADVNIAWAQECERLLNALLENFGIAKRQHTGNSRCV
ncbi:MAG: hypothetical protein LBL35_05110 [Clostridiales bacterium]|nr:hypothetical protein [Clostridiales bacterium]